MVISLSWNPPGAAQPCFLRCSRMASSDMGEDVDLGPSGEVERGTMRQEIETGLGQLDPAFAPQAFVEFFLQRMQIAHVGGRIFLLRIAELGGTPVRALLLLRQVMAEQLAYQILEAMPVGIGPDQARSGLGAIGRGCDDAEIGLDGGDIEAG